MSGECILVIDDSPEIVKLLSNAILPTHGFEVRAEMDAESALVHIQDRKPDLILLDYHLPGMTGIDVLRRMGNEGIAIPVVLMTGYGSEWSAIEAFRLGAKDYLVKPFTTDEVIGAIERALVESRLLHDKEELAGQLRRAKMEVSRQSHDLGTLYEMGRLVNSPNGVEDLMREILATAISLTGAEAGHLFLANGRLDKLHYYELDGENRSPNWGTTKSIADIAIHDALAAHVMESGEPWRFSSFSGPGIRLNPDSYVRASLYVPLIRAGKMAGALGVTNDSALRSFDQQHETVLNLLANLTVASNVLPPEPAS